PSAPISRKTSRGMASASSQFTEWGARRFWAKSRAISRIMVCSSVKIILTVPPGILKSHSVDQLERHGRCFAAADAEGSDTALLAVLLQRREQCHDDARARCADRMAEGTGAAMHIDLGMVEA